MNCALCRTEFAPKKPHQRYCSEPCRSRTNTLLAMARRKIAKNPVKPLAPGARPLERQLLTEADVPAHRRLWCRQYDACLQHAERNHWRSFTCCECPVRDEVPESERIAESRLWASRRMTNNAERLAENGVGSLGDGIRQGLAKAWRKRGWK